MQQCAELLLLLAGKPSEHPPNPRVMIIQRVVQTRSTCFGKSDAPCALIISIFTPSDEPRADHAVNRRAQARRMNQQFISQFIHTGLAVTTSFKSIQRAENTPLRRTEPVLREMRFAQSAD
jgi:hypothetical protein